MIINDYGEEFQFGDITYVIGELVYSIDIGLYHGLFGIVTEICTDPDEETENFYPTIFVDFLHPVLRSDISKLQERFSSHYRRTVTLRNIPLSMVKMYPHSVIPVKHLKSQPTVIPAYLLHESKEMNGRGKEKSWIFTENEDAETALRCRLAEEADRGVLSEWRGNTDRNSNEQPGHFEAWLEGTRSRNHLRLTIIPQSIVLSEKTMEHIYDIQLAKNRRADFEEEISQWEETEELTEEQLCELLNLPDIPKRIQEKLSTNISYWEAYYQSLSEASYEIVKEYIESLRQSDTSSDES